MYTIVRLKLVVQYCTYHNLAIGINSESRGLGGLVGSILGAPLLLFKLRDTNLRGLGRGLGGLVGSILGVPLLHFKLRDTNLRGLARGLGGLVGSMLGVPLLLVKLKDTNLPWPGRSGWVDLGCPSFAP